MTATLVEQLGRNLRCPQKARGNRTKYAYDVNGDSNLVVTNPDNSYAETDYDALGRTVSSKAYDTNGVLDAETDYAYNNVGQLCTTTTDEVDDNGNVTGSLITTDYYDGLGRLVKQTDPTGRFTKTLYTSWGQVIGTYVGTYEGTDTTPSTLTNDIIVSQTVPSYDSAGRVWMTTYSSRYIGDGGTGALTPSNARVSYDVQWFDDLGRVDSDVNFGTNSPVDSNGTYNYAGHTYAQADPSAGSNPLTTGTTDYILTQYGYDGFGRNNLTTDNAGHATLTIYDSAGRQEYVVQNYTNFDPSDVSGTVGGGTLGDQDQVTQYVYNAAGLLSDQIAINADANGGTTPQYQDTRYIYAMDLDSTHAGSPVFDSSLLRATVYPDNAATESAIVALLNGGSGTRDFVESTYNANGSVATRTDQNGTTHSYTYDDMGRLALDAVHAFGANVDQTVKSVGYSYDAQDRVEFITSYPNDDGTGTPVNQVKHTYDGWGNVSQVWQSHSGAVDTGSTPSVQYGFDSLDRLHSVTYPTTSQVIYYNYFSSTLDRALGRLGLLNNISTTQDNSGALAVYQYLGDGTIVRVLHPQVSTGLELDYGSPGDGYSGLDAFGRVTNLNWNDGNSDTLDEYTYSYDAAGNRIAKCNALNSSLSETYTYDALNRLVDTQRGGNAYQNWTLDQLGNWTGFNDNGTSQSRTTDAANEIQTVSGTTNNPSYDGDGNMVADNNFVYTYDAWNHLVQVNHRNTDGSTGDLVAQYQYDGRGYRISKAVARYDDGQNPDTITGYDRTDYYYNTSWQVLEERTSANQSSADTVATTATYQYGWDARYIDTPICRFTLSGGSTTQTLYYLTDANHNVTALVDGTDGSATQGEVVERYVYDSYGNVTVLNGVVDSQGNDTSANEWQPRTANTFNNEVLYAGYRYNPETGNYSDRYRDYEAPLGVWLQRDPAQSGADLYEYANSGPIDSVDPTGLDPGGPGQAYWPNWKSRYAGPATTATTGKQPNFTETADDSLPYVAGTRPERGDLLLQVKCIRPASGPAPQPSSGPASKSDFKLNWVAEKLYTNFIGQTSYATVGQIQRETKKVDGVGLTAAQAQDAQNVGRQYEEDNWQKGFNRTWDEECAALESKLKKLAPMHLDQLQKEWEKQVKTFKQNLALRWQAMEFNDFKNRKHMANAIDYRGNYGQVEVEHILKVWPIELDAPDTWPPADTTQPATTTQPAATTRPAATTQPATP